MEKNSNRPDVSVVTVWPTLWTPDWPVMWLMNSNSCHEKSLFQDLFFGLKKISVISHLSTPFPVLSMLCVSARLWPG